MTRFGRDNAASSRNPVVTISAVGAELCRDGEGGMIVILGNTAGQSSAYRLPNQVAFDLETCSAACVLLRTTPAPRRS
jgi:hypothetical protein